MTLSNIRANGVHAVSAACEACGHKADINVDALPETVTVPKAGPRDGSRCGGKTISTRPGMAYSPDVMACQTIDRMKNREEQLTWAKQRALICVDMGRFSDAVAGLRTDLAENPHRRRHLQRVSGVSTIEMDVIQEEDFWIIVAARSEEETEIRARKAAGGRRDQGHSARDTSTLFS